MTIFDTIKTVRITEKAAIQTEKFNKEPQAHKEL